MKEFRITLNQRPSALRISAVSQREKSGFDNNRFEESLENLSPEEQRAREIKKLNDRIKILEMELQKAREESFRAGYDEGQQSMIAETQRRTEAMRIEMQSMEIRYLEAIEQIETPLLSLAKKMAEKVLGMELSLREDQDQVLFENLRKMLYEVIDQNKVIVEVHPDHVESLQTADLKHKLNLPHKMEISYVAGKDLRPGEARLQTEDFYVDGTYKNQLRQLHDELKNERS